MPGASRIRQAQADGAIAQDRSDGCVDQARGNAHRSNERSVPWRSVETLRQTPPTHPERGVIGASVRIKAGR
jgi:hypothetical protein